MHFRCSFPSVIIVYQTAAALIIGELQQLNECVALSYMSPNCSFVCAHRLH